MTLFKAFKRQRPTRQAATKALQLRSEQAECTCPEPCERDHGNE